MTIYIRFKSWLVSRSKNLHLFETLYFNWGVVLWILHVWYVWIMIMELSMILYDDTSVHMIMVLIWHFNSILFKWIWICMIIINSCQLSFISSSQSTLYSSVLFQVSTIISNIQLTLYKVHLEMYCRSIVHKYTLQRITATVCILYANHPKFGNFCLQYLDRGSWVLRPVIH